MNVIPLTLIISLGLAALFIVLFARELARRRFTSAESDSLLPLADEQPRPAPTKMRHAHEDGHCLDKHHLDCSRCSPRAQPSPR